MFLNSCDTQKQNGALKISISRCLLLNELAAPVPSNTRAPVEDITTCSKRPELFETN